MDMTINTQMREVSPSTTHLRERPQVRQSSQGGIYLKLKGKGGDREKEDGIIAMHMTMINIHSH